MRPIKRYGPTLRRVEGERGPISDYFRDAIKRHLSQQEMANELGITKATVNKWLKDKGFQAVTTYVEAA